MFIYNKLKVYKTAVQTFIQHHTAYRLVLKIFGCLFKFSCEKAMKFSTACVTEKTRWPLKCIHSSKWSGNYTIEGKDICEEPSITGRDRELVSVSQ